MHVRSRSVSTQRGGNKGIWKITESDKTLEGPEGSPIHDLLLCAVWNHAGLLIQNHFRWQGDSVHLGKF